MDLEKNITQSFLEPLSNPDIFECKICYCEYELSDPEFAVKMLSCGHSFCSLCFSDYYKSLIEDQNRHHALKCPQTGCEIKPSLEEIQGIIDRNCLNKYIRFQNNLKVAQNQNLRFCSKADCETILELSSAVKNKLVCPKCRTITCSKCS